MAVSTQLFARNDKSLAVKVCVLLLGELFYFNWFNARIMTKTVNNVIDKVQFRAEFLKKKYLKKKTSDSQKLGEVFDFFCAVI